MLLEARSTRPWPWRLTRELRDELIPVARGRQGIKMSPWLIATMHTPDPRSACAILGQSVPFTTKDSGVRHDYGSGMRRDTQEGKARFDLLIPLGVPYDEQFLTRAAQLMERGAVKYGFRNWEKANSPEELERFKGSALRHLMQYITGETDEDHAVGRPFQPARRSHYRVEDSMSAIEFRPWSKIPRLYREMVVTEKIDGSNAAIGIVELTSDEAMWDGSELPEGIFHVVEEHDLTGPATVKYFGVYAQSRSRLITPGKSTDNYGFAQWVQQNVASLLLDLGPGLHFGEWWGSGINRGYGLPKGEKRFSLFNTSRYGDGRALNTPGLGVVPVLFEGDFGDYGVDFAMATLEGQGSQAAPGFKRPEGVVVYHTAANHCFKVTIENDGVPKGQS